MPYLLAAPLLYTARLRWRRVLHHTTLPTTRLYQIPALRWLTPTCPACVCHWFVVRLAALPAFPTRSFFGREEAYHRYLHTPFAAGGMPCDMRLHYLYHTFTMPAPVHVLFVVRFATYHLPTGVPPPLHRADILLPSRRGEENALHQAGRACFVHHFSGLVGCGAAVLLPSSSSVLLTFADAPFFVPYYGSPPTFVTFYHCRSTLRSLGFCSAFLPYVFSTFVGSRFVTTTVPHRWLGLFLRNQPAASPFAMAASNYHVPLFPSPGSYYVLIHYLPATTSSRKSWQESSWVQKKKKLPALFPFCCRPTLFEALVTATTGSLDDVTGSDWVLRSTSSCSVVKGYRSISVLPGSSLPACGTIGPCTCLPPLPPHTTWITLPHTYHHARRRRHATTTVLYYVVPLFCGLAATLPPRFGWPGRWVCCHCHYYRGLGGRFYLATRLVLTLR